MMPLNSSQSDVPLPDRLRIVPLNCFHVSTALPSLVRYVRQQKPEALLADKDHGNRTAILAPRLAGINVRVYVCIGTTVAANPVTRSRIDRWKQIQSIRHLYVRADRILVLSNGAAEGLHLLMGRDHPSAKVTPGPVIRKDLAALAASKPEGAWFKSVDASLILAVGELPARKDHATWIRAFARARIQRPRKLAILGEVRERRRLEALAGKPGVSSDGHLPGFVPNPYP
jgi:glycosyltransferase involved in cell wall biosynthesis